MSNNIAHEITEASKKALAKKARAKELNEALNAKEVSVRAPTFEHAFKLLVEQLTSEIDMDNDGTPFGKENGMTPPSERHMPTKIALSQLTQTVHNQLVGHPKINGGKGAKFYMDQYRFSRDNNGFKDRYAQGQLHKDDLKLIYQLRTQAALIDFLETLRDTFARVYQETTGEPWKPYTGEPETKHNKVLPKDKMDELLSL